MPRTLAGALAKWWRTGCLIRVIRQPVVFLADHLRTCEPPPPAGQRWPVVELSQTCATERPVLSNAAGPAPHLHALGCSLRAHRGGMCMHHPIARMPTAPTHCGWLPSTRRAKHKRCTKPGLPAGAGASASNSCPSLPFTWNRPRPPRIQKGRRKGSGDVAPASLARQGFGPVRDGSPARLAMGPAGSRCQLTTRLACQTAARTKSYDF